MGVRAWEEEMVNGRLYRGTAAMLWVCRETGDVVVTGNPRDVEPDGCSEDEGHNCDAAGCRQTHVLARGRVVGVVRPPTGGREAERSKPPTWCPQCGPHVRCDEDGCCVTCGSTCTGPGVDRALAVLAQHPPTQRCEGCEVLARMLDRVCGDYEADRRDNPFGAPASVKAARAALTAHDDQSNSDTPEERDL